LSYIHLQVHSEYSLLEGACRLKPLAKKASEYAMPALALTDFGNMFGAIEFYFACLDVNVKPLLGMEVFVANDRFEKKNERDAWMGPSRLVLLAQNYEGYQNLCRLSTIGYQEGFYWRPRVDLSVLDKYKDNLICMPSGLRSVIAESVLKQDLSQAHGKLQSLKKIYGDRLYLGLTRNGQKECEVVNQFLLEAGDSLEIKSVVSNDVYHLQSEDQTIQDVLVCIGQNKTII
jgi:DNA polymerase III subunit alpha